MGCLGIVSMIFLYLHSGWAKRASLPLHVWVGETSVVGERVGLDDRQGTILLHDDESNQEQKSVLYYHATTHGQNDRGVSVVLESACR